MKRILALMLCVMMLASLTACGCKHQWIEANCLEAKTCSECGEVEGEALGHSWTEATCEAPKTCSACALTEGEALGHTWQEATTEAPKTCRTCAATEGERIITDERFTTSACSQLFGEWSGQITMPAAQAIGGGEGDVAFDVVFTFNNDGAVTQQIAFADWEGVKPLYMEVIVGSLYLQFTSMGMDEAAAQASMMESFGMTIEEYAQAYLDSIDPNAAMETVSMVYYVEGDALYTAMAWEDEMEAYALTMDGDTLTMDAGDGEIIVLTRIAE